MKHLMGLGFALALGVVAAGMNWIWMSSLASPDEFVGIESDLEVGHELTDDDLIAVPVPGDSDDLRKSLIPYENRAILFGAKTTRDYTEGDVVFHRDIQPPPDSSQWDVVGPFKLISVGEKFKRSRADELEYTRTDGNNLTIAVDANFDSRTRRLLEVISPNRNESAGQTNIVAVQVLPSDQSRAAVQPITSEDVVYQTVSLEGIANVPRVLLEGDMIRFVVPARPRY